MDITLITKMYSIFSSKSWHQKDGNTTVFNNFCNLFLNLTEAQSNLIIELTERYTWITYSEYQNKLIKVLDSIELDKVKALKEIILFPIMKPEDEAKTKSGHSILYTLSALKPLLPNYRHIDFEIIETYRELQEKSPIKGDACIYLLDDYLGSGETIKSTIDEILKSRKINSDKINVISIAAQKNTIEYLNNIGISIYTDFISSRGISDYYLSPELEEKIEIMNQIEKMIPANHFSFGYNQSEGLITMMKTPDNTFPIFWQGYKKNSKKFDSPFSRY